MHWTNLGLIFIAGLNIGLASLVWLRNPKNKINITFFATVLLVATWTLGMAFFRESKTEQLAWFGTWLQNGSGAMLVIPFFLLSIYFPYQNKVLI
jgi:superfamily I DNA and RNA helicase